MRELSTVETNAVSGGLAPVAVGAIIVAAIFVAGVIDGCQESKEKSEKEKKQQS